MKCMFRKSLSIVMLGAIAFSPSHSSTPSFNVQNAEVMADEMLQYVKQFLPDAPVLLEAGGHFGEDTIKMKKVWPKAIVHAFEPLPSSFRRMLKEVKGISSIHCYPYALTNHMGTTNFYIDVPNNGASSIDFPVSWNQEEFDKTPIQVPCITLDRWADMYDVDYIDFMWLDMEGHELYALQQAQEILKTVKVIYTEISFIPVRINSGGYGDLRNLLESQGFVEVWKWQCGNGYGDALFIKKDLLP